MMQITAVKHSIRIQVILYYIIITFLFFFSLTGKLGEGSIEVLGRNMGVGPSQHTEYIVHNPVFMPFFVLRLMF